MSVIAGPIVPSLEKKELNVLGVYTMNSSFKAKMNSIFQLFNLEMKKVTEAPYRISPHSASNGTAYPVAERL